MGSGKVLYRSGEAPKSWAGYEKSLGSVEQFVQLGSLSHLDERPASLIAQWVNVSSEFETRIKEQGKLGRVVTALMEAQHDALLAAGNK